MDKQPWFPEATPKPTKATKTTKKKTSLGNLKKPEPEGNPDDLDSVILILLKSHQVSFPIHPKTLFILFVDLTKIYFLIQKEMYFLLGTIIMANLGLVTIQIRMN